MTLFQKVLRELIGDQLYPLIVNLQKEIDSYDSAYVGYDKQLSKRQKHLVEKLLLKTKRLEKKTDEEYKQELKSFIENTIGKINETI